MFLRSRKLKFYLLFCFLFLFIIFFVETGYAVDTDNITERTRQFIEEGRVVRLKILDNIDEISFIPQENIELSMFSAAGEKSLNLQQGKKYTIKPVSDDIFWRIQVFASADKEKARNIRKELIDFGYQYVYILNNNQDNKDIYRVQIGDFKDRETAVKTGSELEEQGWDTWLKEYVDTQGKENVLGIFTGDDQVFIDTGNYINFSGTVEIQNYIYQGKFELIYRNNNFRKYNTLKIDDLLAGILNEEFVQIKEITNLKAAAVIMRTYILSEINKKEKGFMDLSGYYRGLKDLKSDIKKAVKATEGEILSDYVEKNIDDFHTGTFTDENKDKDESYRDLLFNLYPDREIIDLKGVLKEIITMEVNVTSGLSYKEIRQLTWWGPRLITILNLNLNSDLKVTPFISNNSLTGFVDLTEIVSRPGILSGINGGFFGPTGKPVGLLMIDGKMVFAPGNDRSAVGITDRGEIVIDRIQWQGIVNDRIEVESVNNRNSSKNIMLFNEFYGNKVDNINKDTNVVIVQEGKIIEINKEEKERSVVIPDNGYLLIVKEQAQKILNDLEVNQNIYFENKFLPEWENKNIVSVLEAGPGVISNGDVEITGKAEGFQPDVIQGRAPRSALGIKNGNLLLITVDGRRPGVSIGMSLNEMAEFMVDLGIKEGINLDGGFSAQMVVRGFTMNQPLQHRLISNGLLIKSTGN